MLICALVLASAVQGPGAGAREPKMKVLGTDPTMDAPPALDLVSLSTGRTGSNLDIRIGIDGMFPTVRGYDLLPGIEWAFETDGGRHFIAEAYLMATEPQFLLFESTNGSYEQIADLTGTYEPSDGYISMLVPLKSIGAKSGTVVAGDQEFDGHDANSHLDDPEVFIDELDTDKSFRIP